VVRSVFAEHVVATMDGQIAGGDDGIVPFGRALGHDQVARDLLADELVEGLVAVEDPDDVVAVKVGLRNRVVRSVACGVGVTNNV